MKIHTIFYLLFAAMLAAGAEDGAIEGVVVKATGEPIARASVTLLHVGLLQKSITTDVSGKFSFDGLAAGRYVINVERQGYLLYFMGQKTKPLELSTGQRLKDVKLTLLVGAVVAGRVSDDFNEPVANANIGLFITQYNRTGKQLLQMGTAKSDDRGEYRIFNIAPGRYLLQATAMLVNETPGKPGTSRFLSTVYYPGTMDPKQGTWLDLSAGMEQMGMDFRMRPVPTVKVKGTLKSATGQSSSGYLRLQPAEGYSGMLVGSSNANSKDGGVFEFPAVVPGKYLLLAEQSVGVAGGRMSGKMLLQVGPNDLENLVIVCQPAVKVRGTVKLEKGSVKSNESVAIGLQTNDNGLRGGGGGGRLTSSGEFVIENVVPDSYEVMIYGLADDSYVKSMRAGVVDLFEKDLVVGADPVDIELEIGSKGGKIEGEVSRLSAPVAGAKVFLMPTSRRNVLSKQAVSGPDGHFQFRGLSPGSYELYSWENIENGRWWDAEFIAPLKNQARTVKVEAEATVSGVKLAILE